MLPLYTLNSDFFQEIDFSFHYSLVSLKSFPFQVMNEVGDEPMCVEIFEAAKLSEPNHITVRDAGIFFAGNQTSVLAPLGRLDGYQAIVIAI